MGFNLPPGIEVHHIPGNRPEDLEYEEFHEHIEKMLSESIGEQRCAHFFDYIDKGDWEEVLREYVDIAAGLAAAKAVMVERYELDLAKEFEGEKKEVSNEANDT
jgi:hypothetical protein